jgi:hypothetical protein
MTGDPVICSVNAHFWLDNVRWPAVISNPAVLNARQKILVVDSATPSWTPERKEQNG